MWMLWLTLGSHSASVAPLLTANRQAIENLAMELPIGHESIHHRNEAGVVRRL